MVERVNAVKNKSFSRTLVHEFDLVLFSFGMTFATETGSRHDAQLRRLNSEAGRHALDDVFVILRLVALVDRWRKDRIEGLWKHLDLVTLGGRAVQGVIKHALERGQL